MSRESSSGECPALPRGAELAGEQDNSLLFVDLSWLVARASMSSIVMVMTPPIRVHTVLR